eukprot:TRINITY_DN64920_c0_g1_i1.p1 TRINITY_DN64920_c0_g1~~TRINITY_DN64920_c0_g1_i1.p1  ORF type:complete len:366 (-),score=58.69 TRINITY_DN64920_c0_g1_i1:75-1172(-)
MAYPPPSDNLYLQGLPAELDDAQMRAIFNQYGTVRDVKLMPPSPGKPDLVALLRMSSVEEAKWIVDNINGNIPSGLTTPIRVQFSRSQSTGSATGAVGAVVPPPARAVAPPFAGKGAVPVAPPAALGGYGGGYGGGCGGGALQTGVLLTGTVRRWNVTKGFGFIVPDCGGPDVFVHAQELSDGECLVQGSQVTFEAMEDHSKGPNMYRAKQCMGAIKKEQLNTAAPPSDNLFITGMPMELGEADIQAIFSQYGSVSSVRKLPQQYGKTDCAALVRMADLTQAKWLVDNVNGNIPSGLATPVNVNYAEKKGGSGVPVAPPPGMAADGAGFGKAVAETVLPPGPYGAVAGTPDMTGMDGQLGFSGGQ